MIVLVDVQTLTTMFGGIGVGIAAIYYVINLRETNKNRRITFTNSVMQQINQRKA